MKTKVYCSHRACLSLGVLLLANLTLSAGTIVWTNTSGGNWNVPAQWSPNQVPANGDLVYITNAGFYSINVDTSPTLAGLYVGGPSGTQTLEITSQTLNTSTGEINGHGQILLSGGSINGNYLLAGALQWSGGVIYGQLTISTSGVANLSDPSAYKDLYGIITNSGTLNYNGGNFRLVGGNLFNTSSGVIEVQADNVIGWYNGSEVINNAGVIRKSQGVSVTHVNPRFNNSGQVEAQQGSLQFNSGGNLGGTLGATTGAEVSLAGGSFVLVPGVTFSGTGTRRLAGGSLECTALAPLLDLSQLTLSGGTLYYGGANVTNLTLSGSVFYGTNTTWRGTNAINAGSTVNGINIMASSLNLNGGGLSGEAIMAGTMQWNSGTVNGQLTVMTGAVLNLADPSGSKDVYGVITNAGTLNYSGGNFRLVGGSLYNNSSGVIDLQADNVVGWYNGNETIINSGLFRKSQGTNITHINPRFNNSGLVEVRQGSLQFNSGGNLGGTLMAATGANLTLAGGNFALVPGVGFTGAGTRQLTGGSLECTALAPLLDLSPLTLTGGTLYYGGANVTNLTLSGSAFYGTNTTWRGTTVLNPGSLTTGTNIFADTVIFKEAGLFGSAVLIGTMQWSSGAVLGDLTVAPGAVVNLTDPTAFKDVYGTITNAGTLNYSGGNFRLVGGNLYNVAGGLIDLQTNNSIAWYNGVEAINNAGVIRKSGGTNTSVISCLVTNTGGEVAVLTGTLAFSSRAVLTNGIWTVGINHPTNYGKFSFTYPTQWGGVLRITSLIPGLIPNGSRFTILETSGERGCFNSFEGLDLHNGLHYSLKTYQNQMQLQAISHPPETPRPGLELSPLWGSMLVWWPEAATGFRLQSYDNLNYPDLQLVGITGTNQTLVTLNTSNRFYRLVKP